MRGGAIPLLAWGTLLLVLFIGNWIWDAKPVNAATAAFAAVVIYAGGVLLWLARRESIRRGPPAPSSEPQGLPQMSLGAALAGLSIGAILFGLAWAQFLVYFGAVMLVTSLGRLWLELRAERASRRRQLQERQR
jgi:NADH:ubiquinone oxidoreductase subunit 6 (subunit J)